MNQPHKTSPHSKQPGAPAANRNNLRHGLRASRLPPGCSKIESAAFRYRRELEDAVQATGKPLDVVAAGLINTAMTAEIKRALAMRWLYEAEADGKAKLSLPERMQLVDAAESAAKSRDAAVVRLGIGDPAKPVNPFEEYYKS